MQAKLLPNGNMLVPSVVCVDGEIVVGMKEVAPGTPEFEEWAGFSTNEPKVKKVAQPALATR